MVAEGAGRVDGERGEARGRGRWEGRRNRRRDAVESKIGRSVPVWLNGDVRGAMLGWSDR